MGNTAISICNQLHNSFWLWFYEFFAVLSNFLVTYHTSITASMSLVLVVQSLFKSRIFTILHKFSIGFREGEFPDQSRVLMWFSSKVVVTFFAVWQEAKSCWRTPPPLEITTLLSLHHNVALKIFDLFSLFKGWWMPTNILKQFNIKWWKTWKSISQRRRNFSTKFGSLPYCKKVTTFEENHI